MDQLDQLLPQFMAWLSQFNSVDIVLFVFLALYALDGMRRGFIADYTARIARAYPRRHDGRVLLRFPRLFIVATR